MSGKTGGLSPREVLESREEECFRFLREIPAGSKYVLIGGYAVSSFQFPRFSVDLDLVVEEEGVSGFRRLAERSGFKFKQENLLKDNYAGRYVAYVKGIGVIVSLDLMVNSVVSRETGFAYPFGYVYRNSEIREVRGRGLDARARARVADREMLLALKANAMRQQDMRDILALCYEKPDQAKVVSHLRKCPAEPILKNLELLETFLSSRDPHGFKSVFGISEAPPKQSLDNSVKLIAAIRKAVHP